MNGPPTNESRPRRKGGDRETSGQDRASLAPGADECDDLRVVSRDTVPVALVDPDPDQPRRTIDEAALVELVDSIRANGLVSPILVRPVGDRFRIVVGERRWTAATRLGWADIPAEVREVSDDEVSWLQLVENLNRANLSPIEEARAYRSMLDLGQTQETLAARVGKSRSYIAQKMRLLDLPAALSLLLDQGALSEGHVRQLLRFKGFYREQHKDTWSVSLDSVRGLWADLTTPESRAAVTFQTLRSTRPLNWPTGWPFDGKDHPEVAAATEALWVEVAEEGSVLRWAQTAYWYAALTVNYRLSVADLAAAVNRWVELVEAAVFYFFAFPSSKPPKDRRRSAEWWGYHSDLRHAGLAHDHEHLVGEAVAHVADAGSYALPSSAQAGSPDRDRLLDVLGESL